jgi:heat-inducible transcriptional repressor
VLNPNEKGAGGLAKDLDARKRAVLTVVVDEYIRSGDPVGSKLVQQKLELLGMNVSSATIRNDMAQLERLGYLEQPHTSAGRVPSYVGYRYYINELMQPEQISDEEKEYIDAMIGENSYTADAVLDNAVSVLSELTGLTAVNTGTRPQISVITKVEVIPAGHRVYALLMITSMGSVKNKVCRLEFDVAPEQLDYFRGFINDHLQGVNPDQLTPEAIENLSLALGSYMMALSPLLNAVYEMTEDLSSKYLHMTGEQKLLTNAQIKSEQALQLLTQRNQLLGALENATDGISVMFGKEDGSFVVSNSSMIVSHFSVDGMDAGSFGVIGPLRINYAKVIPYIGCISDSVTRRLGEISAENTPHEEGKHGKG